MAQNARKPPKTSRDTAQAQIASMSRLGAEAAAWLLQRNVKSLRDRGDIPRTAEGSYSARELHQWAMRQGVSLPEVDDLTAEKVQLAAEETEAGWGVHQLLRDLHRRYGAGGLALFAQRLLDYLDEYGEEVAIADREVIREHLIEAEVERQTRRDRRERLEIYHRCGTCNKVRQGPKWINQKPPAGWIEILTFCPACEE